MAANNAGVKNLTVLSALLKHVYIPLEEKNDAKLLLEKFVGQITQSCQQVAGTVNINLPIITEQNEEIAIKNKDLMIQYENMIVSIPKTRPVG